MSEYSKVRLLLIDVERAGQRIDNYLLSLFKGVPKTRVYQMIRRGEVRVNSGRIRPDYRLKAGDKLRVPPVKEANDETLAPSAGFLAAVSQAILFEDAEIVILNKPSGMAVHAGSGIPYGVVEAMRCLRPEVASLELAHRLDRETSGCLLLVKDHRRLRMLNEDFRQGRCDKHYLALAKGRWPGDLREVTASLDTESRRGGERTVTVSDTGQEARSLFEVRKAYTNATLLEVQLDTGRTHQIRVHTAHVGHPLAGDSRYGDHEFNDELHGQGLRRLFLHAYRLGIIMADGMRYFEAPLPTELESFLTRLQAA